MKPYSHHLYASTKQASFQDITGMNDKELVDALKYTGLGSGLGAGSGLLGALLLESFKDPNEAQYLRKALQGAGLGALAGGGAGALYGFNQSRLDPAYPLTRVNMLPFHQ